MYFEVDETHSAKFSLVLFPIMFTFLYLLFLFGLCASYTPLSGFHGVLAGFLVGIKQMVPDQELPWLKIKVKVKIYITSTIKFSLT